MKLRARKKSVLDNIKQEDCKASNLTDAHSSTPRATDSTNTVDLTIKQEDTEEHKSLSKQDGDLDKEEYRYQCDLCKMKMPNLITVLKHRTSTHGIKQLSKRLTKNIDVEPDVDDSNFYCKSCGRGYSNAKLYRHHLRQVHYMFLKPMPKLKIENDTAPDPNDPNLCCRACQHTYKRKDAYRQHCRYKHGLNHVKFVSRKSTSSSLTDSYCQACDKRLSSINAYRSHLFAIHKIDGRSIQPKRNDIIPNVNDPNFYCRSCEKKSASKGTFREHLKQVHSVFKSAPKKSKLKPNADDPNNHCRACQKTYSSKSKFRVHLRLVHQLTLTPLSGNVNREHFPDPYNPDHYCSACKNPTHR